MKSLWMLVAGVVVLGMAGGCALRKGAIRGVAEPNAALAASSGKSLDELQRGHAVYMLKCGECHERKLPAEISGAGWHAVVPGMAWNAGLSEADETALLGYLLAAKGAER